MKLNFALISLLLIAIVQGCNKVDRTVSEKYDWVNAESDTHNGGSGEPLVTITPASVGKNYGLKIKNNGKVFFYENGALIQKGKTLSCEKKVITTYHSTYDQTTVIIQPENGKAITLYITYENYPKKILSITSEDWPIEGYINNFHFL